MFPELWLMEICFGDFWIIDRRAFIAWNARPDSPSRSRLDPIKPDKQNCRRIKFGAPYSPIDGSDCFTEYL